MLRFRSVPWCSYIVMLSQKENSEISSKLLLVQRLRRCHSATSAFGGEADMAAKLLTKDGARPIAANIAKLPELLKTMEPQAGTTSPVRRCGNTLSIFVI
jgi:hypothetical protein